MGKLIDLTGQRFGRLTVIKRADNTAHGEACWVCQCDCGNTVVVIGVHLRSHHTKSCGCLQKQISSDILAKVNVKCDGRSKTRLYRIWVSMIKRCQYSKQDSFERYGGRGITVCQEWQDFDTFAFWARASGYGEKLSIDRIDVNGNYCPENCRWATAKEQQRNTRYNRNIEYDGRMQSVSAWAEELGINVVTLFGRLYRGWPVERALTEPVHAEKNNR